MSHKHVYVGAIPTSATMKIFILDDMVDRQQFLSYAMFKLHGDDAHCMIADSFDTAIRVFKEHKEFDIMFLDHDLGGKVYVSSNDPNTGYQVAKYMVENNITSKEIIVHSLNPAGVQNMLAVLPKHAIYVPYTLLRSSRLPDSPV